MPQAEDFLEYEVERRRRARIQEIVGLTRKVARKKPLKNTATPSNNMKAEIDALLDKAEQLSVSDEVKQRGNVLDNWLRIVEREYKRSKAGGKKGDVIWLFLANSRAAQLDCWPPAWIQKELAIIGAEIYGLAADKIPNENLSKRSENVTTKGVLTALGLDDPHALANVRRALLELRIGIDVYNVKLSKQTSVRKACAIVGKQNGITWRTAERYYTSKVKGILSELKFG